MKDWEWSLREYILIETREKDMTDDASKLDILDILKILGERVKNSEGRFENNELNLVLHYEIKTVLSFLWMCYPEIDNDNIVEVGYLFSHYYHYVPNYAYSVVKVFLQIMKNKEDKFLYKIAEMSRVMGDIQRLMGRKEKATDYYNQAVEFCHKQISRYLELCCGSKELNDDEKNIYEESLRIKAGVLLIRNYTFSYDETDETEFDEAIELYKKLDDEDGKAYYNQRMGELYYSKAEISNDNRIEMYNQIKKFYDASYKLNKKLKNKTGVAYIQKCQGDLKVKFKDSINEKWFGEAVKNYYDAFMTYYGNINWRGFANVMQAMNTCLRLHRKNEEGENPNITLYNLAEECYRWLGDVRGLADTLDYEGHELRGIKNEDDTSKGKGDESERAKEELHQYMALGKWLESRELWSKQENKQKVTYADNNITELKLLGGKSWGIWT